MATLVVSEWERGLRFVDGRLVEVLGAGRHRYCWRTRLLAVDLRPRLLTVPGQDVLTSDGLAVKVSLLIRWLATDPVLFATASPSPSEELYAAAQLALREAVANTTLDSLIQSRTSLNGVLTETTARRVDFLGVRVDSAVVKDVILSGELRHAFARTAMAREEGKAALERARAEAASMRSLANTAALLEDHPALLHLLDGAGGGGAGDDRRVDPSGDGRVRVRAVGGAGRVVRCPVRVTG